MPLSFARRECSKLVEAALDLTGYRRDYLDESDIDVAIIIGYAQSKNTSNASRSRFPHSSATYSPLNSDGTWP